MNIKFFEGFNYSDSDVNKLDSNYWTYNSYYSAAPTFAGSRTSNGVALTHRPNDSGVQYNTILTLNNFTDPLISHSGFGVGFNVNGYAIITGETGSGLNTEKLVSFHDSSNNTLSINLLKTTYNGNPSMGLGVYQNNAIKTIYDLNSILGNSFQLEAFYVSSTFNDVVKLNNDMYLEIYVDGKNNNQIAIMISANSTLEEFLLNSSNNIYTSISPISNLSSIKFYGSYAWGSDNRLIDDLYITSANSVSGALLGSNTHIYPLPFYLNSSPVNWQSFNGDNANQFSHLNSNDGDNSYAYSNTNGDTSLFNVDDLPNGSPSNVGGIKLQNNIKKTALANNTLFTNVMTSGNGGSITNIGSTYTINNNSYASKNSFVFTNPITGSGWTKNDINNMQIGIKNLGNA